MAILRLGVEDLRGQGLLGGIWGVHPISHSSSSCAALMMRPCAAGWGFMICRGVGGWQGGTNHGAPLWTYCAEHHCEKMKEYYKGFTWWKYIKYFNWQKLCDYHSNVTTIGNYDEHTVHPAVLVITSFSQTCSLMHCTGWVYCTVAVCRSQKLPTPWLLCITSLSPPRIEYSLANANTCESPA